MSKSNGVFFVVVEGQEFLVYWKWKPCVPVVLLGTAKDMQVLFKHLIGFLTCSICLRVIHRADVPFDVKKMAEF